MMKDLTPKVVRADITGPSGEHLKATLHDLAFDLAKEWGLSENDMDMYYPPDLESAQAPMVIVAGTNQAKEKVIGVCLPSDGLINFDFGTAAQYYLVQYEGKAPMEVDISRVAIKVLAVVRQPAHGQLVMDESNPYGYGTYYPNKGYLGKDRIEAIVLVGKDVVRVVYNFVVQAEAIDDLMSRDDSAKVMKAFCPKGLYWKISGTPTDR
jgi:hypothetical protein